ncbi:hypothetical protein CgunFtcFv8_001157 [Champsocephalus gunnari]|uniref:Uncharacterized protein n=1 Tax=Champsocephalus gunnari TaxID=52237 RepID=A0AAN8DL45_CHAGU|nr:hypothetical protein CgunFtcFv8_001157 [Champsocephalus gunnari]
MEQYSILGSDRRRSSRHRLQGKTHRDRRDGGPKESGSEAAGGRHPKPGSEGDQGSAGDRGQRACGEAEGRLPSWYGLRPGV